MKTVLITGASSGIGRATAVAFSSQGWRVVATMRNPADAHELASLAHVHLLRLDVTDSGSVTQVVVDTFQLAGQVDVIVNNAGYGGFGAFEQTTADQIQAMFAVNVFGPMALIRAFLPYFRQKGSGLIINISSVGGLMTYPLYSVYHSTKWALEGFSESLHYELHHLGIGVKLIEPGVTRTDFNGRSQVWFRRIDLTDYDSYINRMKGVADRTFADAIAPEVVAATIVNAATDKRDQLRYIVGNRRSRLLVRLRGLLPTNWFIKLIRQTITRND